MTNLKHTFTEASPWLRWTIYAVGVLILLLIILQILISIFADDYLSQRLKNKIRSASHSTYTLTFDDLDLGIFSRTISIKHARLETDTSAFSRPRTGDKKPPAKLFTGTIGKLTLSGIHFLAAVWGDELHIGAIAINKPDLTVLRNPHPVPKDSSSHFSSVDSSLYATISNKYDKLIIGNFTIRNAKLRSLKKSDTLSSLQNMNLSLKNITVDSATAHSKRIFITDDISLTAGPIMLTLPDSLNQLRLGHVNISSDDHILKLDSLQLVPLYPKFKFSEKHGRQIDRLHLIVPTIVMHRVDFTNLIDSGRFHSSFAEIDGARLKDFHSKIPPPPIQKKPLPNNALLGMHQKINIDSLKISNAFISYSQYKRPAPKAGKVTFEKLHASIYNLTNYGDAIKKGTSVEVYARARVMGKGLLKTHFTFPLNTHNGFHKIQGSLSRMKFTDFNPILKYIAFAKADRGTLNHIKFNMTLNNNHSSGTLIMNYQNLKISVLDKKTLKQKGMLKNIESFAANNFVIKDNNTPKGGMRAGTIGFTRIKTKGAFNFWWKSLFSGIKKSVK